MLGSKVKYNDRVYRVTGYNGNCLVLRGDDSQSFTVKRSVVSLHTSPDTYKTLIGTIFNSTYYHQHTDNGAILVYVKPTDTISLYPDMDCLMDSIRVRYSLGVMVALRYYPAGS